MKLSRSFELLSSLMLALLVALPAAAEEKKPAEPKGTELPIKRVVLFSSGVGYFEHQGKVNGDARVELKFPVNEVNDLLKSMLVEDQGGGRITGVGYGSREPMTRTLKTFSIDLTRNLTLADLLRQVRGESILVEAPQPITGKIVSVERRKSKVGKDETVEVDVLNLLTPTGLKSINLETVGQARLLDEKLNAELQQALAILAEGNRSDKRTVTIASKGNGNRDVRVGYIQETPIWKTSYRLVLSDDGKPLMQGWAIVENMTEQDWKNVELTFVSGRPISFVMDLYQPLYVGRPIVVPDLFASLQPRTYEQDLASREGKRDDGRAIARGRRGFNQGSFMYGLGGGAIGGGGFGGSVGGGSGGSMPAGFVTDGTPAVNGDKGLDPNRGVASAASAAELGELFRYQITHPVSVDRQQSAMLPIVNEKVEGQKVSIYNPAVHAKHPLNGLKLVNSTKLHLMQGPITVYDDGAYAGDAQIIDMAPGAERLVSYAMDLDLEVAPELTNQPQQMVSAAIAQGVLRVSNKHTRERTYTVKNSDQKSRRLLIEQPLDTAWKLVSPKKPDEKSRSEYRFALNIDAGKKKELKVAEERIDKQQWVLVSQNDQTLLAIAGNRELDPKIKAALQEIIDRRQQVARLDSDLAELNRQVGEISQEQSRIRANMGQLDRNSELYRRYVTKIGAQEDSIEKLTQRILSLRKDRGAEQAELEKYIATLNID